jgi:hypothetical protein
MVSHARRLQRGNARAKAEAEAREKRRAIAESYASGAAQKARALKNAALLSSADVRAAHKRYSSGRSIPVSQKDIATSYRMRLRELKKGGYMYDHSKMVQKAHAEGYGGRLGQTDKFHPKKPLLPKGQKASRAAVAKLSEGKARAMAGISRAGKPLNILSHRPHGGCIAVPQTRRGYKVLVKPTHRAATRLRNGEALGSIIRGPCGDFFILKARDVKYKDKSGASRVAKSAMYKAIARSASSVRKHFNQIAPSGKAYKSVTNRVDGEFDAAAKLDSWWNAGAKGSAPNQWSTVGIGRTRKPRAHRAPRDWAKAKRPMVVSGPVVDVSDYGLVRQAANRRAASRAARSASINDAGSIFIPGGREVSDREEQMIMVPSAPAAKAPAKKKGRKRGASRLTRKKGASRARAATLT